MQKMYPRTTPAPFGALENSNVIPALQIEEAIRESVRQNAAHIPHEPEKTSQVFLCPRANSPRHRTT
jgi:hypothetical protein